jgi:hypothetical protein
MDMRGVLITGASGFIGGHVARWCAARGIGAWAWTRDAERARARLGSRAAVIERLADIPVDAPIDAVVNLAGAPVFGPPWTEARRRVLIDSRVKTTQAVLDWVRSRAAAPRVLASASAIGFYGAAGEEWLDESSPPQPRAFQSQLCMAREAAADAARELGMRVVNLRLGLVLGPDGGILPQLARPARFGMAAVIGDGRQWMSWIHLEDMLRILELTLDDATIDGPVNVVAPQPVRQRDFQRALARTLRRPLWLRVPGALLNLALGEMAELLVRSQRVAPSRLEQRGFEFRYPELETALRQILTP